MTVEANKTSLPMPLVCRAVLSAHPTAWLVKAKQKTYSLHMRRRGRLQINDGVLTFVPLPRLVLFRGETAEIRQA